MADRQTAIKSLLAVMDSTSRIQQEQNKIKMNMLENSQKFQNSFFESMMKNKMETQQKQEMVPFELEQKRQEKQMMNPLETEQFNQYKTNPGGFSAPGKPITPDQRLNQIVIKNQGIPEDQWPVQDKLFIQQYQRIYGKTGDQPITDAEGNITGYRPRGAVFQPKTDDDTSWMGGQPKTTPAAIQPSGRIRVKTQDGQTGTIEAGEFDPSIYEKI